MIVHYGSLYYSTLLRSTSILVQLLHQAEHHAGRLAELLDLAEGCRFECWALCSQHINDSHLWLIIPSGSYLFYGQRVRVRLRLQALPQCRTYDNQWDRSPPDPHLCAPAPSRAAGLEAVGDDHGVEAEALHAVVLALPGLPYDSHMFFVLSTASRRARTGDEFGFMQWAVYVLACHFLPGPWDHQWITTCTSQTASHPFALSEAEPSNT